MLNIGIAIALLVLCSSYKSCPIVSKLTGIKVLTIILTVLASIKLMSFLFGVLPMYYGSESENYHPILSVFASSVFAITVIYYCGVITLSVIACIKGYKCMSNNELTSAAYSEPQRVNAARAQQIYHTQSAANVQQSFATENTAWQCTSCGKYNESDNKFCIYCGHIR